MDFLHAAILGVVEGLTEFLPISSTGHLILAERLLGVPATEFWQSFSIAIQLGAIAVVLLQYERQVLTSKRLFSLVAVAFLPTALVGLLLYPLGEARVVGEYSCGARGIGARGRGYNPV